MESRVYCSEQNAHEPLCGTADPVDVWLLLEFNPVWKARAVEDSNLDPGVRKWLTESLSKIGRLGLKGRVQFIRQQEGDRTTRRLFVGVPRGMVGFSGDNYDFIESIDVAAVVDNPLEFPVVDEPHYFVCTNGQRDLCCARFGLPIYRALRDRVGSRVWQTTHLGGHRFAPNVLVLPQGAVYGRVELEHVGDFVEIGEGGRLDFRCLRGRTWYPPVVQAAEILIGRSDLKFLYIDGDDESASVTFEGPDGKVSATTVGRVDIPLEVVLSCGDIQTRPVRPFQAKIHQTI